MNTTIYLNVTCICSLNLRPGFRGNSHGLKLHFLHFDYIDLHFLKQHMNPQINFAVFLKSNKEKRYSTHGVLGSSTSSK